MNDSTRISPREIHEKEIYARQNKVLHIARAQLAMTLDDLRALAGNLFGEVSISSLTVSQRSKLIDELKAKGAQVYNVNVATLFSQQKEFKTTSTYSKDLSGSKRKDRFKDYFMRRLEVWDKRFHYQRPDFATNRQLALIESLWKFYFEDGREGSGLRGFVFRQTGGLENGPVSDLSFLRDEHVGAVLHPLKEKAKHVGVREFYEEAET
jgi:hypothetical protein